MVDSPKPESDPVASRPGRSLSTMRLILHRLRTERGVAATIALVTLVTAAVLAGIPRHLENVAQESLRHDIDTASTRERGVAVVHVTRIPVTPDGVARELAAAGDQYRGQLPDAVKDLLGTMRTVVDTGAYTAFPAPGGPTLPTARQFTLRVQPGHREHAEIIEGRWPQISDEIVDLDRAVNASRVAVLIEVALSRRTSEAMGTTIGERMTLAPSNADAVFATVGPRARLPAVIEIVGIFEPTGLDDPFWYGDGRVHVPGIVRDPIAGTTIFPMALLDNAAYDRLPGARLGANVRHEWRFDVDTDLLTVDAVTPLISALREGTRLEDPRQGPPPTPLLQTGLNGLLGRHLERASAGTAVLTVGVVGLLALTISVVGLAASLLVRRRENATALLRGRGATAKQLLGWQFVEAAAVAAPGAIVGGALGVLVPGQTVATSWLLAAAVGVGAVVATLAVSLPSARQELRTLLRSEDVVARPTRGRRILEALLLIVAAIAVSLARNRGVGTTGELDPFLALTPVLLTVAAALVTARVYLLPARLLATRAARRRGAVAVTSFRQGARQAAATTGPLTVLLLAVSVAVFAASTIDTVRAGQEATSWETVGADLRIDQVAGTDGPGALLGVDGSDHTDVLRGRIAVERGGGRPVEVDLLGVETDSYPAVLSGSTVPVALPDALTQPPPEGEAADARAIPVIVSSAWPDATLPVGHVFRGTSRGIEVLLRVAAVRDRFPGFDSSTPFVVLAMEHLEVAAGRGLPRNSVLIAHPSPDLLRSLRDAVADTDGAYVLFTRDAVLEAFDADGLIAGILLAFLATVLLAGIYGAVALFTTMIITARSEGRDLAFLRTLGFTRSQTVNVIALRVLPVVGVAVLAGTALGWGTAVALGPSLDLSSLTGSAVAEPVSIGTRTLTALAVSSAAAAVTVILLAGALARRLDPATILREVDL